MSSRLLWRWHSVYEMITHSYRLMVPCVAKGIQGFVVSKGVVVRGEIGKLQDVKHNTI